MRRLGMLTATTASVLILGGALPASDAVAQQKSLKEQLGWNVDLRLKHQYPGGWQW